MWRHLTRLTVQSANLCRLEIDKMGKSKPYSLGNRAAYFRICNNDEPNTQTHMTHKQWCNFRPCFHVYRWKYTHVLLSGIYRFAHHLLREILYPPTTNMCTFRQNCYLWESMLNTVCNPSHKSHEKRPHYSWSRVYVCLCVFLFFCSFFFSKFSRSLFFCFSWVCVSCFIPTRKFVGSVYDRYFKPLKCPCIAAAAAAAVRMGEREREQEPVYKSAVYKCIFYDPANVFPFEMCVLFRRHYDASDGVKRHR